MSPPVIIEIKNRQANQSLNELTNNPVLVSCSNLESALVSHNSSDSYGNNQNYKKD